MSDKITVELTETEARNLLAHLGGSPVKRDLSDIAKRITDALPPEYPEGTIAWVTSATTDNRYLAAWHNGGWRVGQNFASFEYPVSKVEPIHTLADDEIAVKRAAGYPHFLRSDADVLDKHHGHGACAGAALLRRAAAALEAEADS